MIYVPKQTAFYCNACAAVKELTQEALEALPDYEKAMSKPPAFSLVDGTPIQTGASVDRYGRSTYATPGGVTVPKQSMSFADKLQYEKQHITPEMRELFRRQDEQLEATTGRTIKSDRVEIKRSSAIKSSDELIAEKGNVQLRSTIQRR